eukprot:3939188-Rhodomonas_salina.2
MISKLRPAHAACILSNAASIAYSFLVPRYRSTLSYRASQPAAGVTAFHASRPDLQRGVQALKLHNCGKFVVFWGDFAGNCRRNMRHHKRKGIKRRKGRWLVPGALADLDDLFLLENSLC